MSRKGRRLKYTHFIEALQDDQIYSPASIVREGEVLGFLNELSPVEDDPEIRRKIRHTLARLSTNRSFPFGGDGWIEIPGQAPLRGWFGWRWKEAIEYKESESEPSTRRDS